MEWNSGAGVTELREISSFFRTELEHGFFLWTKMDDGIMSRRLDCKVTKKHGTPRALGSLLFAKYSLRLPNKQKVMSIFRWVPASSNHQAG